jgi:hypothetical protein
VFVASSSLHAAVFFSMMIEGSSSNKAIAVYNGNDHVIDLNNYRIERYNNGSLTPSDTFDFTSWGFNSLLPGEVFVIANPAANPAIFSQANYTHTITFFNGDDALVLLENDIPIDIIGEIGVDPGSGWVVGPGATNNFTLIRQASICEGQTNWSFGSLEWDVYPIDTSDGLDTFIPDCQPTAGFISEYIDGPDNNQAIEIHNPGPFALNLKNLRLSMNNSVYLLFRNVLSGYLAPGEQLVISNPKADSIELLNASDLSDPVAVFDGNDSFKLDMIGYHLFLGRDLDQFGLYNNDPGPDGWTVSGGTTNDSTLIRQKQVCAGSSDWGNNANQWQTYPNDYFGDLGSHTIRECTASEPNLVWVWYFATERGLFVTDGSVADASVNHDFNIFEVKISNTALPSMLDEQLIEFQPFQGFSWDGSVPTQFYRSNGSLTNGASFFTLTGPYYGLIAAPDESVLESSPSAGSVLAQGVITVVLDTISVGGFE